MGEPGWSNVQSLLPEHIGQVETTQGTETSKYLEEKKVKTIPLVVASERGTAQTVQVLKRQALLERGCRSHQVVLPTARELQNLLLAE